MITRTYDLEVTAKYQGGHGYGYVTLRRPSVDGMEIDPSQPWWLDKTVNGAPATLQLNPAEMSTVEVGSLLRVTIDLMTTVGDFVNAPPA